jgi:hypothetical protein
LSVIVRAGRCFPLAAAHHQETFMRLTVRMILLLVAVILFVLAAFGVDLGSIAIVPLGLAFFAGAFLVPDTVVSSRR